MLYKVLIASLNKPQIRGNLWDEYLGLHTAQDSLSIAVPKGLIPVKAFVAYIGS
jgi:hypothetical protein